MIACSVCNIDWPARGNFLFGSDFLTGKSGLANRYQKIQRSAHSIVTPKRYLAFMASLWFLIIAKLFFLYNPSNGLLSEDLCSKF
jgi:hypothetical protein